MKVKLFEVRDSGTFIPVFAFRARPTYVPELGMRSLLEVEQSSKEQFLLSKAGYGLDGNSECVIVGRLDGNQCHYDCYNWSGGTRTMPVAHQHIAEHFDSLSSGDVIDVEFILGQTTTKKLSERLL